MAHVQNCWNFWKWGAYGLHQVACFGWGLSLDMKGQQRMVDGNHISSYDHMCSKGTRDLSDKWKINWRETSEIHIWHPKTLINLNFYIYSGTESVHMSYILSRDVHNSLSTLWLKGDSQFEVESQTFLIILHW